jgi:hypothetical protein
MTKVFRLAGLTEGSVDQEKRDVNFVLKMTDGRGLVFVAEAPTARQIASSLGRMALDARQQGPQALAAERVAQYGIKKDGIGEAILLQLVSQDGVPYMFALPVAAAADVAQRLQAECAKPPGTGRA